MLPYFISRESLHDFRPMSYRMAQAILSQQIFKVLLLSER